jgi:dihydroorotase
LKAPVAIAEGAKAEFCLSDPEGETAVTRETMKTKSPVSAFLGETLAGKVCGTVLGAAWYPQG